MWTGQGKNEKMTLNFAIFNSMKLLSESVKRRIRFTSIVLVVGFIMFATIYTNDVFSTIVISLLMIPFMIFDYRRVDIVTLEKSFYAYRSLQNNEKDNSDEQYIYSSLFNNITALILILSLWLGILVIICFDNNCNSIAELPIMSRILAGSIVFLIGVRVYLKRYVKKNFKINFKILKEKKN